MDREFTLDQGSGAAADHRAGVSDGDPGEAFPRQDNVQGRYKIARCIGERAVEIEDEKRAGGVLHCAGLRMQARNGQDRGSVPRAGQTGLGESAPLA